MWVKLKGLSVIHSPLFHSFIEKITVHESSQSFFEMRMSFNKSLKTGESFIVSPAFFILS